MYLMVTNKAQPASPPLAGVISWKLSLSVLPIHTKINGHNGRAAAYADSEAAPAQWMPSVIWIFRLRFIRKCCGDLISWYGLELFFSVFLGRIGGGLGSRSLLSGLVSSGRARPGLVWSRLVQWDGTLNWVRFVKRKSVFLVHQVIKSLIMQSGTK